MRNKVLLFAVISVSFFSLSANAQQSSSVQKAETGGTFKRLDRNGDGKIDRAEAQMDDPMAIGLFDQFDLNHDGVITAEEVQRYDEQAKSRRSGKK